MSDKIRVAVVVSHPIQHFVHLYRALALEPGIELLVIYACDIGARRYFDRDMGVEIAWKTDLFSGYRSIVLEESPRIERISFWQVNNPSVTAALESFRPQAVLLHGYAQLTLLRALMWCRRRRIPAMLWSDSSLSFRRPLFKRVAKKILINMAMRQFGAVLTTGDNNAAYYRHYGVPETRLFRCPFTVDEAGLIAARRSRAALHKSMRERYRIADDAFVLLFVGKLTSIKRPFDILDALHLIDGPRLEELKLVAFFAGDGPLRGELEARASELGSPAIFGGFINVDVLPSIYAMADALVFPSGFEPYGLAAREAVCIGLPLIVSDQIGCIGPGDAARTGINALVYPAGDVHALTQAMVALASDPQRLRHMGEASLGICEQLSLRNSVSGVLNAVEALAGA